MNEDIQIESITFLEMLNNDKKKQTEANDKTLETAILE